MARSLGGGKFELLSVLGEGSVGAVYRARHAGLGSMVAVKVLHDAFQRDAAFCRRFHAEALAMSRLDHPNLLHVYDFGQEPDGLLYIAMPLVDGISLRELLQREGRFDLPRIVHVMVQVCAGLSHAHMRGLIHRDVKPDNVMIVTRENDDGEQVETVKLVDFGFAVPPSISGEIAQRLAGTPVYMSPEQCRGEPLDERSDVYACGIMLYELATGSVPFLSQDLEALRRMHLSSPPPLVAAKRPAIDPRYERIVQRALSKSRDERHANMLELRAELKSLVTTARASSVDLDLVAAMPAERIAAEPAVPAAGRPSMIPPPPSRPVTITPSAPPPAARSEPPPEWLERGPSSFASFIEQSGPSPSGVPPAFASSPSAWLGELTRERDPRAFVRRLEELEGAVRTLAESGDARTLQRVSVVVAGLSDRAGAHEGARSALAEVARLFTDPEVLGPTATRLLMQDDHRAAAAELITRARVSGAIALYAARAQLVAESREGVQRARIAFVTTMKSLGSSALPVLRPALERLFEQVSAGQRGAAELAEDVLLSVPRAEDPALGSLVLKLAGVGGATLWRAAARALPRVWGERARPVLLQLIAHEDDSVCLAAVASLHDMDAIDLEAVTRISRETQTGRVRTAQMRAAFVTALSTATASAQAEAMTALARLGALP